MPHNVIYRFEWSEAGSNYRLDITPPHATPYSSPAVVQIPDECITLRIGKAGYEKHVIGLPDTPALPVSVDLGSLNSSTDLQDLRGYILNPAVVGGGTLSRGGAGPDTRSFDLGTVWTIYTDYGTQPSLDQVFFQGVQRARPTRKHKVSLPATGGVRAEVEVTLLHIARVCMEIITPDDIARKLWNNYTTEPDVWIPDEPTLYHNIWKDVTGLTHAWYASELGDPWNDVKLCRVTTLVNTLNLLASQVYGALIRTSGTFAFSQTVSGVGISPLSQMTFYTRAYDTANTQGAALSYEDVYFVGAVWPHDQPDVPENYLRGVLVDNGENSDGIFRFTNAWDMMRTTCESYPQKTSIVCDGGLSAGTGVTVTIGPVGGLSGIVDVAVTNVENTEIEFEEGAGNVRGARVAVPGMGADDLAEVFVQPDGTENEQEKPIRLLFNNAPRIGTKGELETRIKYTSGATSYRSKGENPDIVGSYVTIRSPRYPVWTLFYRDTPNDGSSDLTSREIAIAVHDAAAINDGGAAPFTVPSIPPFPVVNTAIASNATALWLEDMVVHAITLQRQCSIAHLVSLWWRTRFTSLNNVTYNNVVLPLTPYINMNRIGHPIRIGSGSASAFLNTETFYNGISTETLLLSCEPNPQEGNAKCSLSHIDIT